MTSAFSRLILILWALVVKNKEAKMILRKPDESGIVIDPHDHYRWPCLYDDQWMKVEVALKDLILSDYAKKNNANVSTLTQSKISEIIRNGDEIIQTKQR